MPHKQVEHAIDAALELRAEFPGLRLAVVGSGWWEATLHEYAAERGAGDTVVFEGHVDEQRKNEIYETAWVMALPSLKEGWGLVVGEAGMHRTPTVAYRSAGGTRESIVDGRSGLLVDDQQDFVRSIRTLLADARVPGSGSPTAPRDEPSVHLGERPGVVRRGGRHGAGRRARRQRGPDGAVTRGAGTSGSGQLVEP